MHSYRAFKPILLLATVSLLVYVAQSAKIVDFGAKLSEFVDKHPDKGFLIKFYAPWCHHCQQLEPVYKNMAEHLYTTHNTLVIGQVDCTQSRGQCDLFGVQAFPEIIYIKKDRKIKYEGNRGVESMVSFANRVHGPDVNRLYSCKQVKEAVSKHGVIILSNINNSSSVLRQDFQSIAGRLKARHWFYHFEGSCNSFIGSEGIHLAKQDLDKAIMFNSTGSVNEAYQNSLEDWIESESFPVYGQLLGSRLSRLTNSNKNLVVAILDFYQPAAKFTRSSYEFHKAFGRYARQYVQKSDDFVFAWTSDLTLVETVALQSVIVPNIMIIKSDLSYHLLLRDQSDLPDKSDKIVPQRLKDSRFIEEVLDRAKSDSLDYQGGNGYIYNLFRSLYRQYMKFRNVYKSEPILATVLMALPTTIFVYILYIIFSEQRQPHGDGYERLSTRGDSNLDNEPGNKTPDEEEGLSDEDDDDESRSDENSNGASTRSSQLSDDFEPIEIPDDIPNGEDEEGKSPLDRKKTD